VDVGTHTTRAGFAGEENPKCAFPTVFLNHKQLLLSHRIFHFLHGFEVHHHLYALLTSSSPFYFQIASITYLKNPGNDNIGKKMSSDFV
jgi:actin-related protein